MNSLFHIWAHSNSQDKEIIDKANIIAMRHACLPTYQPDNRVEKARSLAKINSAYLHIVAIYLCIPLRKTSVLNVQLKYTSDL